MCRLVLWLLAVSAGYAGAATIERCCKEKTVGGVSYTLVKEGDTGMYGCWSDCIFERVDTLGSMFCFKQGDLEVVCDNEGSQGTGIIWTATGEVPDKLAQAPPQPLYLAYSGQEVRPNNTVTTDDMLDTPTLKWETEEGALYTIVLIDFGIERLGGLQFYHWLVANVQDSLSIATGDEVEEYIAPFYFATNEDGTALDTTVNGTPGHDILVLVYRQKNGSVEMIDERQSGCDGITSNRIGDHVTLAEKYDLELIAGNFFFTTYTEATNYFLCLFTKCTGEQFPVPAPGINDGPECQQEPTTTTS